MEDKKKKDNHLRPRHIFRTLRGLKKDQSFVTLGNLPYKNKYRPRKKNLFLQLNVDVFGDLLRRKKIDFFFFEVYYKYCRFLIARPWNMFYKLEYVFIRRRINKGLYPRNLRFRLSIFRFYANIRRKQFYNLFKSIKKGRGFLVDEFVYKLESRLDMVLFRMLHVCSLGFIRQLILHKNVYINNQLVVQRHFFVKPFDIISFFPLKTYSTKHLNKFNHLYSFISKKTHNKRELNFLFKNPSYIEIKFNYLSGIILYKFRESEVPFFFKKKSNNFLKLFN